METFMSTIADVTIDVTIDVTAQTEADESYSPDYTEEEIVAFRYYRNIANAIWKYVPGFIIVFGSIGNILSALVMTRPALRKSVSSLFFTVLAFVDTFCLVTGLLRYWLRSLTGHDIRTNSDLSCKLHTFLVYWSADFSGWILVLVAAERCFGANFPHLYKPVCTRTKAVISLVICAVLLAIINIHFLFGLELQTSGNTTVYCGNKDMIDHFHNFAFPWIDLVFFCIGPFICIFLCNLSIIFRVLKSRAATEQKSSNRISSMTTILICVSVFYIVCTFPVGVYLIYQNTWVDDSELVFYGKMQVYWAVGAIMSYLNNSMNFSLYCISGPRFRKELVRMFGCLTPSGVSRGETSVSGL